MAESSNKKPEKVINMSLTPSSKLQHSASSLSDPEFNPTGLGRLDITPNKGLEITVRNTTSGVLGNLHLKPPGLIFHCTKSIVGKIIHVASIATFLSTSTQKNDTVTIFHYEGSNKLTFVLGSNSGVEHNVELLEMDAEVDAEMDAKNNEKFSELIEGFPPVASFCEAALTSNYLRAMVQRLEEPEMPQRVMVSVEEFLVTYLVGRHAWQAKFGEDGIIGTRGMEPGQMHRAVFVLPNLQVMKIASNVAPGCVVSFLREPADSVMMRFGLDMGDKLGDLVYIFKAERLVLNCQIKKECSSEEEGSGSEDVNASDSSENIDLEPGELEYLGFSIGPTDSMAESSADKVISFQLAQASKLMNSAFTLSNSRFNPTGMARVDITETGFEITVRNTETGVVASLHLNPSGMISFHCSKPIIGKFININNIFLVLIGGADEIDTVTIFHLDGSNELTFIRGDHPDEQFKVALLELDAEVERIPDIKVFSQTILTSDVLTKMMDKLEEINITQQVLVNIAEKLVTYFIGRKAWAIKYGGDDKTVGTSGTTPGMVHRARFILQHLQALRYGTSLGPYLVVCILSEPADSVMIRFCFQELGNLMFIYKAEMIATNRPEVIGSGSAQMVSDPEVIDLPPDQAQKILEFKFR